MYIYLCFKTFISIYFYISMYTHIYIHTFFSFLQKPSKELELVAVLNILFFFLVLVNRFQMQIHSHYPNSNLCHSPLESVEYGFDLSMWYSW